MKDVSRHRVRDAALPLCLGHAQRRGTALAPLPEPLPEVERATNDEREPSGPDELVPRGLLDLEAERDGAGRHRGGDGLGHVGGRDPLGAARRCLRPQPTHLTI